MSSDDSTSHKLLEKKFVYQNNATGAISSTPLTTRQLCKLLCPASGIVLSHITPNTQVLGVSEEGSFDISGWKAAKTVNVLQDACAQWYYSNEGKQQGPYSCRQLSELVLEKKTITNETQVWSSHLASWESIEKLPNLMAALQAFRPVVVAESSMNGTDAPTLKEADMAFDNNDTITDNKKEAVSVNEQQVQDELQAFLSSTAHLATHAQHDDDNDEGYTSDNGTNYVKDPFTGNWIHADLAPKNDGTTNNNKRKDAPSTTTNDSTAPKKKRHKKPKFSARNAKCWIYIQGLPHDTTLEELTKFCSKAGIIELDPETQRSKIKLYREQKDGSSKLKGDASICYARPESVELALQLLDEAPYRPEVSVTDYKVSVTRAKFQQHGDEYKKKVVSNAKRKVAKLAALQAIGWDEDDDNGRITGGRKGLRIVVLKHVFTLEELQQQQQGEDAILEKLQYEIRNECEQWGTVEKITVFSKHKDGIVIVKFAQPSAASTAVKEFDGRPHKGRRMECIFWDGVTDYTVRDEEKEARDAKKRQEEFGEWLETQQEDLPEELRLQTES